MSVWLCFPNFSKLGWFTPRMLGCTFLRRPVLEGCEEIGEEERKKRNKRKKDTSGL